MSQKTKMAVGLSLGFLIGIGCRALSIPLPSPPTISGGLLVVCMTAGYLVVGHFKTKKAGKQI